MLTLNLLPEQYKEEYRFERKKRLIVSVGISLSLIFFVCNALLASTYVFLTIYQKSFEDGLEARQTSEVAVRLAEVKKSIRTLNTNVALLQGMRGEIFPVAPILERISLLVKPGIYVRTLSFDAVSKTVQLAGFAQTREGVLELADALSGSDFVLPGSLESPVKNILKEEEIEFTFTFQIVQ